jgi:hypothetical protein
MTKSETNDMYRFRGRDRAIRVMRMWLGIRAGGKRERNERDGQYSIARSGTVIARTVV